MVDLSDLHCISSARGALMVLLEQLWHREGGLMIIRLLQKVLKIPGSLGSTARLSLFGEDRENAPLALY